MLRDAGGQRQWVARAFLVPKPGKNDWRLVIDYRHLNSCLKGNSFPLHVIEDRIANHEGSFFFHHRFGGWFSSNASEGEQQASYCLLYSIWHF